MKLLLAVLLLSSSFAHAADVKSQACTNPSRGLILVVPDISGGKLAAPLTVSHLIRTVAALDPSKVTDLQVTSPTEFSFKGAEGEQIQRVSTTQDSVGRLLVQVNIKDVGLVAFTCPRSSN